MFRTCALAALLLLAAVDAQQISGSEMKGQGKHSDQDGDPEQVEKLLTGAVEGDVRKVEEALAQGVWIETKDESAYFLPPRFPCAAASPIARICQPREETRHGRS